MRTIARLTCGVAVVALALTGCSKETGTPVGVCGVTKAPPPMFTTGRRFLLSWRSTFTSRKCDTALPVGLSSLIWMSGML